MKTEIKKLLGAVFLFSLIACSFSIASNINAMSIPEGAVIKTANNPDVYIVKYKNGKQFKRLVLNPQVFESYGHLKWEDILMVDQVTIDSFVVSDLVMVFGQGNIYQLIPNGDTGSSRLLISIKEYDLSSVYIINSVDFENYKTGEVKGVENLIDTVDNDFDGLENWEENQRGTDKNNPDTDGDGIVDGLDSHPTGGGRLMAQHFEWDYLGSHWTWDLSFPSDWYDYYKNKKRESHGAGYVTYDDFYIKQIATMLEKKSNEEGYSKSEFAVAFIQSLGYVKDSVIGYDDYPKYPIETLAEQNGDCEDTSYLVSAIVMAMGIDNVLVELPNHMAIAIAFSGSPEGYYYKLSNGWDYYYIETTAEGWKVGAIPDEYKNQKAELVKIPSNEIEEKSPSYIPFTNYAPAPSQNDSKKAEELQRLTKAIQVLERLVILIDETDNQLDILYDQMEEKKRELGQTNSNPWLSESGRVSKIRVLTEQYNSLVEQYNGYLEIRNDLVSVAGKVNDYGKYGTPLSYKDKSFLESLRIDF